MKQNFTVRQGTLDGVEAFLRVAQYRSFRRAAAELGVTPSAISQAVRALEARVGAALFIRTTRSVGLTEAGARFLSRAKPAFEELVAASEVARDLGQRPTGLLRLTVPRAVVPILLEPLIASFCKAYPEVEVEIAAGEELVDLAAKGFDAGVRMGQFIATDMVAVRLTPPFPFVVVGSPNYLRRHRQPERIDDLRQHACLRIRRSNGSIAPWSLVDGNKTVEAIVSGPLIAHDFPTMLGAAVEGMGLAQVPAPIATSLVKTGKLVQVLKSFAPMAPGVFLYYPSRHQTMPKLRAFIDHVKGRPVAAGKTRLHVDDKRTRGTKAR
ncbi:LysR family transcriptional regulator [Bradyrhizobium japonicum]|uniref:LysR family transcriptional regulator n=1 Tax=Bradyrhizobium japonicum TaxID=375 RepID=UPI000456909C|nr:LysR family transcriptional regulator [Bradyrhizobium japonicum]AHY51183.1 transcriptional regulator [Bradyrhizobium japonicum SEMIA 5079]MCD9105033.1 LysR family transcriptional regulator [Bradyrhizobium japonicum]MCD9255128.1 LysR family transcriptional regulator [Bradyrhizobium japonicum SEMIA 5079]MCD9819912.1 LysR family transcriptional regulator [Bradyrhizobium japonicum]MCD9892159.1 LysR family transcriptional regulator [Bradyrhizobium japonicum]